MKVEATPLADLKLVRADVFQDARGVFLETWNAREFARAGIDAEFVQDNLSISVQHTLRGLHYQVEKPQGKLVRVVQGEVFDVAVDIRRSSPTFGCWYGDVITAKRNLALWIPPGFAHGFLVLSQVATFEYKCTDFYAPEHERAIRWNDPDIGIEWPLPEGAEPKLSDKDAAATAFRDADTYS
ncbi:MAG: dTDP-4-dehydrorhamnose 3,5-epimerase [Gammaproteobacteria bacterium]|nr:dTDP-4-dehydrorhamnose 3,5-epimerase [Gammaproteobacteria bacterium]MDH5618410.1 dTDP-4-dehydrorhamnose 3,5-epimerase [Gammaproteobacteria bacterium]